MRKAQRATLTESGPDLPQSGACRWREWVLRHTLGLAYEFERIGQLSVYLYAKMQMGSGSPACAAHIANDLSFFDPAPHTEGRIKLCHVHICMVCTHQCMCV